MFFALQEIILDFIQLPSEAFRLVLGCLGVFKSALCNCFGGLEPFFESSFLLSPFFLGNSRRSCAKKYIRKSTLGKEKGQIQHRTFEVAFLELHFHVLASSQKKILYDWLQHGEDISKKVARE